MTPICKCSQNRYLTTLFCMNFISADITLFMHAHVNVSIVLTPFWHTAAVDATNKSSHCSTRSRLAINGESSFLRKMIPKVVVIIMTMIGVSWCQDWKGFPSQASLFFSFEPQQPTRWASWTSSPHTPRGSAIDAAIGPKFPCPSCHQHCLQSLSLSPRDDKPERELKFPKQQRSCPLAFSFSAFLDRV